MARGVIAEVSNKGRRGRKVAPDATGRGQPASAVSRTYNGLRELILNYEIKPGERLNEVELARSFGVSRTPLREALNRLVVERLLGFEQSLGFFRPNINAKEIIDLYELRVAIETLGVRLAVARSTDAEIEEVETYWADVNRNNEGKTRNQLIVDDEKFHEKLVALGKNDELVNVLRNINSRIHFIRWADPHGDGRHDESYEAHHELLRVLRGRDEEKSVEVLRNIIERRREDIVDVLKEGVARLYIG